MSESNVLVRQEDSILEVTVNRPKANAIDTATSKELGEVFCNFRDVDELRVAIVTGSGDKFFSAGWDLKEAASGEAELDGDYGPGGFAGLCELHDLNKPVISAVNGYAIGGGFELALSGDLIIAADHAQFFLPEIKVGVVADAATFRLTRWIPRAVAIEMLLTGRRMSAKEALRWGLINQVVPLEQLMDSAWELARTIAEGAPLVVTAVKEILRKAENASVEDCYRMMHEGEFEGYEQMKASADAIEGPKAFAEKREASWKGQ